MHLLTHLYGSCYVVTADYRLIRKVDDSLTVQAPWGRTPGELLTDPLPRGVPWTNAAKKEARTFVRRKDMKEHDAEILALAKARYGRDQGGQRTPAVQPFEQSK
jgi:hypothetical protein